MSTNVVKITESVTKTREVLEEQQLQQRNQERIRKANALKQTADQQSDAQYELTVTAKQILAAIKNLGEGGGGGKGLLGQIGDFVQNFASKGGAKKQEGGYIHKAPVQAFQGGGGVYTVPGNSTGDNHDMMLPEGSFVLNREASKYLQSGGEVGAAMPLGAADDMVPVKTESQEMIFGPKSWNSLIPILNDLIPRFPSSKISTTNNNHYASGGYVGSNNVVDIGKKDYKGRAIKLSPGAAQGFKEMIKAGMPFKENDVTNVYRDEREYLRLKNAGYSPAANSMHNHGNAADLQGGMNSWIRQNGGKYGWRANDYAEGTNWHFEYHGPSGSKSTPPSGAKETKKSEEFVPQQEKEAKSGGGDNVAPGGDPQSPAGPLGGLGDASPIGTIQKSGVDGGATVSGKPEGNGNWFSNIFGAMGNILAGFGAKSFGHMGQMIWSSLMGGQGLPGSNQGGGDQVVGGGNQRNVGTGRDGTFGDGTHGKGRPSDSPITRGGAAGMMSHIPTKPPSDAIGGGSHDAALLSFISKGEGDYNSMNQGTDGDRIVGSTHDASTLLGKNLTDMSIGEVMQHQASGKLFAAGRYQIIPSTMELAVKNSGLSQDDPFNKANQDKLGLTLIYNGQRPELSGYLQGKHDNINSAMLDFSKEWASVPDPNKKGNVSHYGNGNRALHTKAEVKAALEAARQGNMSKGQKFQTGGMVPVKVESGEKIFMPGTFGPELSALNSAVPRFQNGGGVTNHFSNNPTMVTDRFKDANVIQNSQQAAASQPIVVPMPVMTPGENPGGGIQGGSETNLPELTASPSNYLASALLMQSHALMQRIG